MIFIVTLTERDVLYKVKLVLGFQVCRGIRDIATEVCM